ncbi:serine hydrolase [Candidatus Kaiserbacteria bacterium]|nr:serine hydrolase [Candidatus Kaiserbacteria bacterium]
MALRTPMKAVFDHMVRLKPLWWLVSVCATGWIGFGLGHSWLGNPAPAAVESIPERHLGRISFTNPLIDVAGTNETNDRYAALKVPLEAEIAAQIAKQSVSTVAVYFQDLETGKWFGINERAQFAPASLMKVPLMVVYYKLAEYKPTLLEETIVYNGEHAAEANLPPAQRLALGKTYTIDELIYHMIVHSDNVSRGILSDYLETRVTPETHNRLAEESMTLIPANYEQGDEYEITPIDYASVFRILYNATYLSEAMSERALALLAESSYDSGIVNGVPEGTVTANKFGIDDTEQAQQRL